ncbi:(2Fe-2S)-binding protein [Beggiatoa alba]|nr:(2Fe-2S)-binding protein [Beggiatoa alba]
MTDSDIRCAVEAGTTSMRGLRDRLGCSGQCGKCARKVRQLRDQTLDACGCQQLSPA